MLSLSYYHLSYYWHPVGLNRRILDLYHLLYMHVKCVLTSLLLSLWSRWRCHLIAAWGDLAWHSKNVLLPSTPYCTVSRVFLLAGQQEQHVISHWHQHSTGARTRAGHDKEKNIKSYKENTTVFYIYT